MGPNREFDPISYLEMHVLTDRLRKCDPSKTIDSALNKPCRSQRGAVEGMLFFISGLFRWDKGLRSHQDAFLCKCQPHSISGPDLQVPTYFSR